MTVSRQNERQSMEKVAKNCRSSFEPEGSRFDFVMADPPKKADDNDDTGRGTSTGLLTRPETRTKKPNMYKVLLLNDDYTPMEFVVHVLQRFFRMTVDQATEVMLHVHQKGVGICGVFTYEVAETKVNQVLTFAQQHEHPLQCTLEKE